MFKVLTIPCLRDNYSYLLVDIRHKIAAAVDPVDANRVGKALASAELRLWSILTTHHHQDHSGGNEQLVNLVKSGKVEAVDGEHFQVYGGDERIPGLTRLVKHGDRIRIGSWYNSLEILCLKTPGHTSGHFCYFVESGDSGSALFSGDTLFSGGCGRLFEGSPNQMHSSLLNVLGQLPEETLVYPGHEYTKSNLEFAMSVEPENEAISSRLQWCDAGGYGLFLQQEYDPKNELIQPFPSFDRALYRECCIPSSLKLEFSFNPFLRIQTKQLQSHFDGEQDSVKLLGKIRKMKDHFR